jgi:hypothetical protein
MTNENGSKNQLQKQKLATENTEDTEFYVFLQAVFFSEFRVSVASLLFLGNGLGRFKRPLLNSGF